jgi:hypothetical protein
LIQLNELLRASVKEWRVGAVRKACGPVGRAMTVANFRRMIDVSLKPPYWFRPLRRLDVGLRRVAMLAFMITLAVPCVASADALQDAQTAYAQNRLGDARAGFQSVLDGADAQPRARAVAARELARIAWLIDRNATASKLGSARRI